MSSTAVPWPGQQGQVDGEAGLGHRLGQRPEGLGVAGETVEDEHAVGPPSRGPRLGTWDDRSGHEVGCYRAESGRRLRGGPGASRGRPVEPAGAPMSSLQNWPNYRLSAVGDKIVVSGSKWRAPAARRHPRVRTPRTQGPLSELEGPGRGRSRVDGQTHQPTAKEQRSDGHLSVSERRMAGRGPVHPGGVRGPGCLHRAFDPDEPGHRRGSLRRGDGRGPRGHQHGRAAARHRSHRPGRPQGVARVRGGQGHPRRGQSHRPGSRRSCPARSRWRGTSPS